MVNQDIRGSFECYINASNEITNLDHVAEVNEDIVNLDSAINMNLWALNEEKGYDSKIKEKIDVKPKMIKGKLCDLKQFIELPNQDKDGKITNSESEI
jgi:hypothetical protein